MCVKGTRGRATGRGASGHKKRGGAAVKNQEVGILHTSPPSMRRSKGKEKRRMNKREVVFGIFTVRLFFLFVFVVFYLFLFCCGLFSFLGLPVRPCFRSHGPALYILQLGPIDLRSLWGGIPLTHSLTRRALVPVLTLAPG